MKSRILIIAISLLTFMSESNAQNIDDALRYSDLLPGGTARVIGAGSSFGAMGGDLGSYGSNIAGLAEFRSSEVAFSFSFNNARTTTSLDGLELGSPENGNEFIIENIGIVFHKKPLGSKFKTSNFSFGIQQYSNFNQVFRFNATSNGSIVQRFEAQANIDPSSIDNDDFETGLAFDASAIFFDDGLQAYASDVISSDLIAKEQIVERSGRVNEFVLAWAGKYDNNLNIGLGFGIPFVSFEENRFYEESDLDDSVPVFNSLAFNESLTTSGIGWNFKVGLGYNIKKIIRLGLAYQTPTFMRLDDNFNTSIVYDFDCGNCGDVPVGLQSSPDGISVYRLRTPSRLTGSIGTLINTDVVKGFVNLDVTRVDYSGNNFNFTSDSDNPAADAAFEIETNEEIAEELGSALNFNLGTELAFKKFRVRAGINFLGSPLIESAQEESKRIYSTGLGWRGEGVYFDLAYQLRDFTESYIPYRTLDSSPELQLNNSTNVNKFVVTIGIKI